MRSSESDSQLSVSEPQSIVAKFSHPPGLTLRSGSPHSKKSVDVIASSRTYGYASTADVDADTVAVSYEAAYTADAATVSTAVDQIRSPLLRFDGRFLPSMNTSIKK
jgi:hypothetical protein